MALRQKKSVKWPYWISSMALFTFFLSWSFAYSLFPLWLNQAVGLSGQQTGLVFAANALSAMAVMPLYGVLQDKMGVQKKLLYAVAIQMICVGPFFHFVYQPLLQQQFYMGLVLGAVYSATAFGAAVGALEAYMERTSRFLGYEFGKVRSWGSLGWAIATFYAGSLINTAPMLNAWISSVAAVLFLLCVLNIAIDKKTGKAESGDRISVTDALSLFKLSSFWRFIFFITGVSGLYHIYDQQFPIYFASLFPTIAEGNQYYGYLNSVQVFLEVGCMFITPMLVNRIGAKNGLLLSGAVMAARIIASGMIDDVLSISAIKLLHALELPLLLVSSFKYIVNHFDTRLSTTMYLLGFHVITQLTVALLSSPVGAMYDKLGFADAYKVIGAILIMCLIASNWLLECDKQIRDNPRTSRD